MEHFLKIGWWGRVCTSQVCTVGSGWYTSGPWWHTVGPGQAREMGWQEAHEGQQQEVQSSVLGVAKLHAPVYAGAT